MFKNNESDVYSLQNTCRTCMQNDADHLITIFGNNENENHNFYEILNLVCEQVTQDDGLPQQICSECNDFLISLREFRLKCAKTQLELNNLFAIELEVDKTAADKVNETRNTEFEFFSIDENACQEIHFSTPSSDENHLNSIDDEHVVRDCDTSALNVQSVRNKREALIRTDQNETSNREIISVSALVAERKSNEKFNYELKCQYCAERFSSTIDLKEHIEISHPKNRPHICPICKKSFQSVSNRNTHVQSHNKENSFKCDICGQGFKSKVYLSRHTKAIHAKAHHQCYFCAQIFDNTVKFVYHLKSHDPNKKYKCKFCEKSFLQHHHLANHERTHTGYRPYLCPICGKEFKQDCNYKLHLRLHDNIRPYSCNICNKCFIQRGSLAIHMRQHTGVRPYQCEHCGKNFVQKSTLNMHMRTHTGTRCESLIFH